ncbi:hypothetical protein O6H91_Y127900 [Diphasiastrum complanatum]|nr:hypothetical protein O6H91_Y127900 [Diphasiastrum complanatum]
MQITQEQFSYGCHAHINVNSFFFTQHPARYNFLQVDRRYRIYSDQMHAVVASFDSVLGVGAAIPYTALALQAMSRYFRCLRDAISGQIQLVCKALGEEEIGRQLTNRGGISRLRYVDQQLRQQRSFQQLGMLQQHAWRPQRGLPERSVSVLRAWLFEHFLHPYPKDADKIMLARQTGLTRSQVSNWFINARVRLWKPMVEEMYQEEARDKGIEAPGKYHGEGDNSHSDGITDLGTSDRTCKTESRQDQNYTNMAALDNKITSEGASDLQMFLEGDGLTSEFNPGNISSTRNENMKIGNGYEAQLYEDSNPDGLSPVQMKKSRIGISNHTNLLLNANKGPTTESDEMHNDTSCDVENKTKVATRQDSHIYSIPYNGGQMCHDGSVLTPYEDGNLSRAFTSLYPVNGVSLTLGLRHCDNLSLSANRQSYLHGGQSIAISRRETVGTEKNEYGNSIYEGTGSQISDHQSIDYPNSKHIEMQMLHDFVA